MAPFSVHPTGVDGIKDRIESIAVQGDRLFIGTGTGDLHIYGLQKDPGEARPTVSLLEVRKNFTRRSIDQLGFIKDTNSLVVLSDNIVTLYALPLLTPATPLVQTRGAAVFALNTAVLHIFPDGSPHDPEDGPNDGRAIPAVITYLVVGCRKKVVIFTWRDGEAQDTKETALPHTPRAIAFPAMNIACLAYTQSENVLLSLKTMNLSEISLPNTNSVSVASLGMGIGALSGLSSYMTLGLGAKTKPSIVKVDEGEVLIPKDNSGIFVGPEGKPTRPFGIDWAAAPEENASIKPYILSVLPAGTVKIKSPSSTTSQATYYQSSVIQVTSSISLLPVQTLAPPFGEATDSQSRALYTTRLLTLPSNAKPPLFLITTPQEKATATAEGSALWMLSMQSWGDQIDELVDSGSYPEALALLDTMDKIMLPDKELRKTHIRTLHAITLFAGGLFDDAMDTFIELDINPAKVMALYPESISGRLSIAKEKWFELHGGKPPPGFAQTDTGSSESSSNDNPTVAVVETPDQAGWYSAQMNPASLKGRLRAGLDMLVPTGGVQKEDETPSLGGRAKEKPADDFHRSVETLLRYLGDRRPKLWGALSALHISPSQSSEHASLFTTSIEELFALPNSPPSALVPDQLVRFAQIVDTALFKSYLAIRPSLLAPLCRIDNWCEVSEVEQVLYSRGKYSELIFLYHGKRMHDKALKLLHEMSLQEDSVREKLGPTINYLQKLGPAHLPQIFDAARWVFTIDLDMGLEIFTSEEAELPRQEVTDYLEGIDPHLCVRYLEYLIHEREELCPNFHERLAELYLSLSLAEKSRGNSAAESELYSKLLRFISESQKYRIDRLFGLLPTDDMFEARAVLLGRLGKHEGALEIYVYRLQDYIKAEEYCKRVYHNHPDVSDIFLILLRIYLQPSTSSNLLRPALNLISRHSPRLDAVETLQLLPPMVTAQDLKAFLCEALREPLFDTRVIREIWRARSEQVSARLISLQTRRVKITDSRICPQCHKRIGSSVIAVHAPRGEVTHYTCREAFSHKLKERLHGS